MPCVAELGDDDEDRVGLLPHELDVLVLAELDNLTARSTAELELERCFFRASNSFVIGPGRLWLIAGSAIRWSIVRAGALPAPAAAEKAMVTSARSARHALDKVHRDFIHLPFRI